VTLQEKLNSFKKKFQEQVPEAVLEIMHKATEDLRNSEILAHIPKAEEVAPDFQIEFSPGQTVHLRELVQPGPAVISFYRGVCRARQSSVTSSCGPIRTVPSSGSINRDSHLLF
jgi:hypothetical protein